jgi:undecaprenyl-diphosphatase
MNRLEAAILALIQGITEFLPVSSSGHLALASELLHVPESGLAFDIILHLGTLVAVFVFYWKDITGMLCGIAKGERKSLLLTLTLVSATVPVALTGLFFSDQIEELFSNILFILIALAVTGTILFLSSRISSEKGSEVTFKQGLIVGIAQSIAILPGISRSGTTICAGLFAGLKREEAARFSFLLAIPAILGAAVKEIPSANWDIPFSTLLIGFIVSAAVGFVALTLLVRFVKQGRLAGFAWYLWAVSLSGILITQLGANH